MATSSITHNFVISNPESVKRFVAAIEEAEYDRTLPGRQLTDYQFLYHRRVSNCTVGEELFTSA